MSEAPPVPPVTVSEVPVKGAWTTGILDIADDPVSAIIGYCLPCVLYAQTAEKVHGGDVVSHCLKFYLYSCICACGFVSGPTRKALREEYDLPVQPGFLAAQGANADCMTGTIPCVNCFALCQDAREANTRNITTPIYKVDPFEWAPLADRPTPAAAVATQAPAQPAMEK